MKKLDTNQAAILKLVEPKTHNPEPHVHYQPCLCNLFLWLIYQNQNLWDTWLNQFRAHLTKETQEETPKIWDKSPCLSYQWYRSLVPTATW